jgi:hypothetical protein
MLAAKIFQSDDLEGLETQVQAYLDSIEVLDPGFDWGAHDIAVQYDGKTSMSRMCYSCMIVIKPNS